MPCLVGTAQPCCGEELVLGWGWLLPGSWSGFAGELRLGGGDPESSRLEN